MGNAKRWKSTVDSLCPMQFNDYKFIENFFKDYVEELIFLRHLLKVPHMPLKKVEKGKLRPIADASTMKHIVRPSQIQSCGIDLDIDLFVLTHVRSDGATSLYAGSTKLQFHQHFEPLPLSNDNRSLRKHVKCLQEHVGEQRERIDPSFSKMEEAEISYVVISPEISEEDALKLAEQPGHGDLLFMSLNDLLHFPSEKLPQVQRRSCVLPSNEKCTIM